MYESPDILRDWLYAFLFTQVVEIPIYLYALRRDRARLWAKLGVAFGASALTHPIVWFVIPRIVYALCDPYEMSCYVAFVAVAESFAFGAEALYLWAFGLKRAWLWSFLANGASFGLGMLSREVFGWP